MRCPKCKFISADKRDLCPKCLLDLRPEKLRTGLPVTRPKASYEELLRLAKSKRGKGKGPSTQTNEQKDGQHQSHSKKVKPIKSSAPTRKRDKETQSPIFSRLIAKFSLAKRSVKIASKEISTTTDQKIEQTKDSGIDEKAFESIFEKLEDSNLIETTLPTQSESKVGSEPSKEDFAKLEEEMSLKLAQAITSTELLRELPTVTYISQISQATPEVVEFDEEDDALLEEQLNQLLGDEVVEISSVKVPKKVVQPQEANSIQVDDLEISFEFDLDNEPPTKSDPEAESKQSCSGNSQPQSFETKSISELEAALLALESEFGVGDTEEQVIEEGLVKEEESFGEIDTIESLHNDLIGLEDAAQNTVDNEVYDFDLSPLKGSIPLKLKDSPSELTDYLLQVLADTVGCKPEDLFKEEANLKSPKLEEVGMEFGHGADKESDSSTQEEIESIEPILEGEASLWDLAEIALLGEDTEGEELELVQLLQRENNEELLVLFDAALDALDNKKLEEGYSTKIRTSEDKELDSEDLSIVFERYADAAIKQHDENSLTSKKESVYSSVKKELPPIQFTEVLTPPLSKIDAILLLLKSTAVGIAGGLIHLWFFDLMDSSKEAILGHQLFWLALPHIVKNLSIAIILGTIVFFLSLKFHDKPSYDPPLTL